jgi:hypothetical protein
MKGGTVFLRYGVVLLIGMLTSITHARQEGTKEAKIELSQLPSAVVQAIKTNCAGCPVDRATREIENGVTVYDIEFKDGQGEIALAEDGTVIDRETIVQLKDVPDAALDAIRKGASGGKIKQVAKDEIRAELKDGQIIKLGSPQYVYEAELVKGNQIAEIEVSPQGKVIEFSKWRRRGAKED